MTKCVVSRKKAPNEKRNGQDTVLQYFVVQQQPLPQATQSAFICLPPPQSKSAEGERGGEGLTIQASVGRGVLRCISLPVAPNISIAVSPNSQRPKTQQPLEHQLLRTTTTTMTTTSLNEPLQQQQLPLKQSERRRRC